MAYMRENLVSRAGYSGMGSIVSEFASTIGGALTSWGASQGGAPAPLTPQQQADIAAAQAAQNDHTTLYLGLAGAAALAYFLMRKKKGG